MIELRLPKKINDNAFIGKLSAILLIGALSMLLGEVFANSSQAWFLNGYSLFYTFPLYMIHVIFFLSIALRIRKISLPHLYFFGVIFGLYESWISKVIWAGYMDSAGPGLGTFLGLAVIEFPILVFFWHPIMSFIAPVLVFEIMNRRAHREHISVLKKTRKKTVLILVWLISIGAFIANGNGFSLFTSNLSILGSVAIISFFYLISKDADLDVFDFGRIGFIIISLFLCIFYVGSFFLLLPGRIPTTFLPYLSVILFYPVPIYIILRSRSSSGGFTTLDEDCYSIKDLLIFTVVVILAANASCLLPSVATVINFTAYFSMVLIGPILFGLFLFWIYKR